MKADIHGAPSFAYIDVTLEKGESIFAESDAMASMAASLEMKTRFNGGFFRGLMRKFLGGESLFINEFINTSQEPSQIVLVQPVPGEIRVMELNDESFCFQPGAYVASTPGVTMKLKYAGLVSFIAREGLFKLEISGRGKVWYGAFGGFREKMIDGEYIVDSGHLVGYAPNIKLKMQLAGGLFASFLGGEGLVTRLEGKGKVLIQSRSLSGLAAWINPKLWP